MAELSIQNGAITFSSANAGGDTFENNGHLRVIIKNVGSSGSQSVTFDSQMNCQYGYDHNKDVSVGQGETYVTETFSTNRFNDDNEMVHISYSDNTVFEIAVIPA